MGLVARRYLQPGELILEVPLRLALTDQGREIHVSDHPHVRLACSVLQQRALGRDSAWAPYLDVLPRRIDRPADWPRHLVEQIEYGPAKRLALRRSSFVRSCAAMLRGGAVGASPADAPLTAEQADAFRWASAVAVTRAVPLPAEVGWSVGEWMLLPVLDFINYANDGDSVRARGADGSAASATSNCEWRVVFDGDASRTESGVCTVTATEAIDAGDELRFSCGTRGSDELFVDYGFVPTPNAWDWVQLFRSRGDALDALLACIDLDAPHQALLEVLWPRIDLAEVTNVASLETVLQSAELAEAFLVGSGYAGFAGLCEAVRVAVARRCWDRLGAFKRGVLTDLALLARDGEAARSPDAAGRRSTLERYFEAVQRFVDANAVDSREPQIAADVSDGCGGPNDMIRRGVPADEYLRSSQDPYNGSGSECDGMLSDQARLTLQLLASKKRIMWDIILSVRSFPERMSDANFVNWPSCLATHRLLSIVTKGKEPWPSAVQSPWDSESCFSWRVSLGKMRRQLHIHAIIFPKQVVLQAASPELSFQRLPRGLGAQPTLQEEPQHWDIWETATVHDQIRPI